MIHNRSFVPMNPDKKEINELEHSPFDFIANEGNIHSYAASLIPSLVILKIQNCTSGVPPPEV